MGIARLDSITSVSDYMDTSPGPSCLDVTAGPQSLPPTLTHRLSSSTILQHQQPLLPQIHGRPGALIDDTCTSLVTHQPPRTTGCHRHVPPNPNHVPTTTDKRLREKSERWTKRTPQHSDQRLLTIARIAISGYLLEALGSRAGVLTRVW